MSKLIGNVAFFLGSVLLALTVGYAVATYNAWILERSLNAPDSPFVNSLK